MTDDEPQLNGEPDLLDTPDAGPTVIRGTAVRTAGYAAGVLLTLISTPLLIRHLGVVDYGRYLTVVSLIFIVAAVTEGGLTNIGIREYASHREPGVRRRLIGELLGVRLALTAAGVLLAIVFAVAAGYPGVMVVGCVLVGMAELVTVAYVSFVIPLSTALRLGWVTVTELVRQIGLVAAIVALVIAGAGLAPFYVAPLVGAVAALAATWPRVRGLVAARPLFALGAWRGLARDAVAYAVATALGVVYFRITIVLLGLVSTAQQVGYFSASFRVIEVVAGVPWLLATSVFPILVRAARDDRARLRYAIDRLTRVALILGVLGALAFGLGAPFVIDVIAGPGFGPSVDVLRIQAATIVGSFLLSTLGFMLLSLRRHRALVAANGVALVVATVLTLVLGPGHGATGAAVATVAAEAVLAAGYSIALFGGSPELRISPRFVLPVAAAAVVAGVGASLPGLPSLATAALACVLYLALLTGLRAIPSELLDAFRGRLAPRRA
jgi:O-antigen/teichoic acid export membrane protein